MTEGGEVSQVVLQPSRCVRENFMRVTAGVSILVLAACATTSVSANSVQPAVACRPVDSTVSRTLAELKEDVASTDPATRGLLDSLKITATRANDVSYVTDEKTCAKAVTALNTLWNNQLSTQVRVYKVGTDYLVEDPTRDQEGGEFRGLQVFDRRWVYKSTFLTF
jgi:hypothetical protein